MSEQAAVLDARLARLTQLESELDTFKIRYRHEVGRRHEELDELEYATTELELAELARQLGEEPTDWPTRPTAERDEPAPRFTSDAVRKLFRDVAKAVHPDLADNEHARQHRHTSRGARTGSHRRDGEGTDARDPGRAQPPGRHPILRVTADLADFLHLLP